MRYWPFFIGKKLIQGKYIANILLFREGASEEVYTGKGRQAEVSDRDCNAL
jgi:hypothetical protein